MHTPTPRAERIAAADADALLDTVTIPGWEDDGDVERLADAWFEAIQRFRGGDRWIGPDSEVHEWLTAHEGI